MILRAYFLKRLRCYGLNSVSLKDFMSSDIRIKLRMSRCLSTSSDPFINAPNFFMLLSLRQQFAQNLQFAAIRASHIETLNG